MSDLRLSRERLDDARDYDPYRLSSPRIVILSMVIFLIIVAFLAAVLMRQIHTFFVTNPGLNGLIFGVLLIGILLAFGQVLRLLPEIRWVNSFRDGERDGTTRPPVLLAPMRALIGRRQSMALTTASMRSILDSIATRLDESRDISRYLIGLLVFLGLLGTFWGLLETVGSIGKTIQSLDPGSGSTTDVLDSLKAGLQAPLSGMGTAFSSSLFGLSGSLILGFLDLQAGRAQNRFYTELENWLSSVTDLNSDLTPEENIGGMRNLAEHVQNLQGGEASSQRTSAALANLAEGIQGLVKSMRSEQQMMRDWVEKQAEEQKAIRETLDRLNKAIGSKAANERPTDSKRPE
ncbi:MotA/TolQ/ExbB proton channel family protein [Brucella pituitosa]|uniref:MotA/TolQ/ExbB proton channel family protein n=1 Tax=Brucella pituitosa TaxID=571256 RepID=UPI000C27D510|nr:MotA/TolQ/ExbB proton channel family protein [Brucella pituitosa]MCK4206366.1 MotA/TolQ/ExbB proton channel family protein [Brucella pituitosa]PJO46266.1 flagellar motor protein MotA [Brucella pituitosa]PRA85261.1 flagellar motor protein MotA [Ochrobactrum sp. MYb29]